MSKSAWATAIGNASSKAKSIESACSLYWSVDSQNAITLVSTVSKLTNVEAPASLSEFGAFQKAALSVATDKDLVEKTLKSVRAKLFPSEKKEKEPVKIGKKVAKMDLPTAKARLKIVEKERAELRAHIASLTS